MAMVGMFKLPSLPFRHVPDKEKRPASSIYSRPSTDLSQVDWPAPLSVPHQRKPNIPPKSTLRSVPNEATPRYTSSDHEPPNSRFSWSTRATNTTYQSSPPQSPLPPMPSMPERFSKVSASPAVPYSAELVNRRRPVPSIGSSIISVSTTRKPVAASVRSATPTSCDKALPRPPPEIVSSDRISTLEAQQGDLRVRRSNIQRLLKDVERPRAQNPLVSDLAARREQERQTRALKEELELVVSEDHEIGLLLHRAYKKRDREADFEPSTTLWVRRVTS